jgi:hypothetical protein
MEDIKASAQAVREWLKSLNGIKAGAVIPWPPTGSILELVDFVEKKTKYPKVKRNIGAK